MVDITEGQASALGVAGGLASSLMGGIFSARQAKSQMRFQRDMYKQRYQFQVEDLKKAGLNPMLAYQQAAPAAPAGAMGQMDAPDLVSSARAGYLMAQELKAMKADTKQKETQAGKNIGEAHLANAMTETQKQVTQRETNAARQAAMDTAAFNELNRQISSVAGRSIELGPQTLRMGIEAAGKGVDAFKAFANAFSLPLKLFDIFKKGTK